MSFCRVCNDALISGENWTPSMAVRNNRLCQACHRAKCQRYYEDNAEKVKATVAAARLRKTPEERSAIAHAGYLKNMDAVKAQARKWRKDNPERHRENGRRLRAHHRARLLTLTPSDADKAKIAEFYTMASRLTRITGKPYHVDHIKPLAMGGLHHQDNMVVMFGPLNQSKGANHWPWLHWFNEPSE